MSRTHMYFLGVTAVALAAVVLAACGGGEATPTPPPTKPAATATSAPAPTAAPAATPTRPPATPTAAPQPSPAPTPSAGAIPTPATKPAGKRGGTLQTRSLFQTRIWDTYDVAGSAEVHTLAAMFNNLIQLDPYSDTHPLVGDVAERWELGQGGTVVTFLIPKGIKWHDGTPFTSKDVAYNFDRAWKPRSPTMTFFAPKVKAIAKIETPDDYTVRITLSVPSNFFLQAVSMTAFQMYPAHYPFPDKIEDFKKNPVGTGPFKHKSFNAGISQEYVRNTEYWRPSLPYLDGHVLTQLTPDAALAAFRTARLDATNLDTGVTDPQVDALKKDPGMIFGPIVIGLQGLRFNQKPPFTDARVREAIDLAMDRQSVFQGWLDGKRGSPYAAPMLPPELGGKWGISFEVMKNRPGYRADKTADLARAKELMAQSGIDASKLTINILGNDQIFIPVELMEPAFRALGFKTKLEPLASAPFSQRQRDGAFDAAFATTSMQLDDPFDQLAEWAITGGAQNNGKWSDPKLDDLFLEQDKTLDVAKRKQLILDLQELFMQDRYTLGVVWRTGFVGHMPWVKNFPLGLPFLFSPQFRHEQVWLDR